MSDADVLTLLKGALGEPNASVSRTSFLTAMVDSAKAMIGNEGITLSSPMTTEDGTLVMMTAEFLVSKRETQEGYPRYLRWALNNRLLKEKAAEEDEA